MPISSELADVYLGNPCGAYFIEAIDIEHDTLVSDLHFTNSSFAIEGLQDNAQPEFAQYIPLPFDANLPDKNTEGSQSLDLSVSNVTAELVDNVTAMADAPQTPMRLSYRVFLTTQVDGNGRHLNQLVPAWRYEVSSASMTAEEVTMSATKVNTHNRSFPRVRYKRTTFPGLAR